MDMITAWSACKKVFQPSLLPSELYVPSTFDTLLTWFDPKKLNFEHKKAFDEGSHYNRLFRELLYVSSIRFELQLHRYISVDKDVIVIENGIVYGYDRAQRAANRSGTSARWSLHMSIEAMSEDLSVGREYVYVCAFIQISRPFFKTLCESIRYDYE